MSIRSAVPSPAPLRHARLLQVLHCDVDDRPPFAFASKEAIREARALGPEITTEAVVAILDGYRPGGDDALASRAAYLVQLGLPGAVPALVACLERLPQSDRMFSVSAASLAFLGPVCVSPLLEALTRVTDPDVRWHLGMSLSLAPPGTADVRGALESMLATEPGEAAVLLARHGDRGAVPALRTALDGLSFPAPGADEVASLQRIINVGHAILELGARLERPERDKLDRANARYDALEADGTVTENAFPG